MSDKKAYFKIEFPTFNELSTELQQIIREGAAQAKLLIFSATDDNDNRVDECEIQWPNDNITYYSIRVSDDQSPHEDSMIFDDLVPCNLSVCNTKLCLQNKQTLERTVICDVIVKTICNGKVNGGDLCISTNLAEVPAYYDVGVSAYNMAVYKTSLEEPVSEGSEVFTLQNEYLNSFPDIDTLLDNNIITEQVNVRSYHLGDDDDDVWHFYISVIEEPVALYDYNAMLPESMYASPLPAVAPKGAIKGGSELIPISPSNNYLTYNVYYKIPESKYTYYDTNEVNLDEYLSDRYINTITVAYKAGQDSVYKEVTGKLEFKLSRIEPSVSRVWVKSIEFIDKFNAHLTYSGGTGLSEKPLDHLLDYGITTYINNEPVILVGIKSVSGNNSSIYISGDQVLDETVDEYTLINQGGDHDNGEDNIVTAIVMHDDSPVDDVIELYAKRDSSGYTKPDANVTNTSTPYEPYIYNLYYSPTTQDETTLFVIDNNYTYDMVLVDSFGVIDQVVSSSTSRIRSHVEDMPSTLNHNSPTLLYELQPDGRLWFGHNSKYCDERYTNVNVSYLRRLKETD